jgi:hypothetical protein
MSTWRLWVWSAILIALGAVAPGAVRSAELDGSAPILCVVVMATECDRFGVCEPVDPAIAGIPPFVRVAVGRKALEATDGSGRKTEIQSFTLAKEQERLLLQGNEGGRLWSLAIGQRGGEMTAAIVDHDGGFLVSGTCTLP